VRTFFSPLVGVSWVRIEMDQTGATSLDVGRTALASSADAWTFASHLTRVTSGYLGYYSKPPPYVVPIATFDRADVVSRTPGLQAS